jgi:hypothetical protein
MDSQAEAERRKRAEILESEGLREAAINTSEGKRQGIVLQARGESEAIIARATATGECRRGIPVVWEMHLRVSKRLLLLPLPRCVKVECVCCCAVAACCG